ncbi:MAG: prohibitin family protein [Bacteroides sp.]|nr:prohibitin family protein [Eubacterium sp.]MCM1418385.1 prohibitin family protein [Roseburia sp.]MCM1462486.1 prohibitin family protein [Bacteroides sp.]
MAEFKFTTNTAPQGGGTKKNGGRIAAVVIVLALILVILFNCFTIVNEGFIGVKYRFGQIVNANLGAGLNFCIPFVENIEQVDIREQVYATTEDAYTSDTQTVQELKLKLNYSYDKSMLSEIIREVGIGNVEQKLLVQNVAKITKNEIGKVKAEELVQSRSEVQLRIENELTPLLAEKGIIVQSFAIENLSFDDAFESSIQAKVIAAQDALKMENKTREEEEKGKQTVIAAQAEADSVKLAADAQAYAIEVVQEKLESSPNYIEYLKITNWNGVLPQVISDGVNPFFVLNESAGTSTLPTAENRASTPSAQTAAE